MAFCDFCGRRDLPQGARKHFRHNEPWMRSKHETTIDGHAFRGQNAQEKAATAAVDARRAKSKKKR